MTLTTCSPFQTRIMSWLRDRLLVELGSTSFSAWLIGSLARSELQAKDCDVLLLVEPDSVSLVAKASPTWQEAFEREFGIPLHLTRLTFAEADQCTNFLSSVRSKANLLIYRKP
jgi:hypothetical protein